MTLVLFVGAILMVAPVSATEHLLPVALAIFVAVAAVDAAYSEYLFGGPVELILAATLTTGVIASGLFVPIVAIRGLVGGPPFPSLDVVVAFGVLAFGVAFFGRRGSRKRAEAAFEEQVRAERARRGKAPTG